MKFTNFLKAAAVVLLLTALAGCGGSAIYNAGTYTGEGQGHGGTIKVAVTVNEKTIDAIEILENPESDFSKPVIKHIIDTAVKNNTAEIDSVSGATDSSIGLTNALKEALAKALKSDVKAAE